MFQFLKWLFLAIAMLGGILGSAIIIMPSKAIELGVTDKTLLYIYVVFFASTIMWAITDSHIKYKAAKSEGWRRVHKRSIELNYFAAIATIILALLLYFA